MIHHQIFNDFRASLLGSPHLGPLFKKWGEPNPVVQWMILNGGWFYITILKNINGKDDIPYTPDGSMYAIYIYMLT